MDIAVVANRVLDAARKQALIRRLARATGRPVDLVDLWTSGVPIRRTVLLKGRCVICRDRSLYAEWLARLRADCGDFLPYRQRLL